MEGQVIELDDLLVHVQRSELVERQVPNKCAWLWRPLRVPNDCFQLIRRLNRGKTCSEPNEHLVPQNKPWSRGIWILMGRRQGSGNKPLEFHYVEVKGIFAF